MNIPPPPPPIIVLATALDLSLNYYCRRYSKPDNVDVFPHRDTSQSTRNIVYTFCVRFSR